MYQEIDIPPTPTFHWADYLVLGIFLLISTMIGVVIGFVDRRKMTSKEFLLGGGDMHYIPVALSMQASFLSAIFILTTPTEIYNFGTMYVYLALSYFTALPLAAYLYLPTFHRLRLTSAYEYLERRFNRVVRIAGSLTFAAMIILYLSVALYTPGIALAQVTGLSIAVSIFLCGTVCVVYTALGGMKATIWNDFLQMIVILLSMLLLTIIGGIEAGTDIWATCEEGGRIEFNDFNPDPTVRTTFWTQVVGGTFLNLTMYASSQSLIQKFLSVKKLKNAQKAVWVAAVTSTIYLIVAMALGLVLFGYYAHCDPISAGRIEKSDQMVPLFTMDVMSDLPGLPGLFMAAAFSGALSTISGGLNALAAVFLIDFIKPTYFKVKEVEISEKASNIISRCLALGFGILIMILGFTAQYFGDLVLQISFSIFGFVGGPLTALISLGLFFPFVNSWGALSGLLTSLGITSWIAIGAIIENIPVPALLMQTDGCPMRNVTDNYTSTDDYYTGSTAEFFNYTTAQPPADDVLWVYKISHMYYGLIAMVIAIVVAIPVSFITGYAKDTDERLTYRWADNCCCYCPAPYKHCLRCGAKHYDHDSDAELDERSGSGSDEEKRETVGEKDADGIVLDGYENTAFNADQHSTDGDKHGDKTEDKTGDKIGDDDDRKSTAEREQKDSRSGSVSSRKSQHKELPSVEC